MGNEPANYDLNKRNLALNETILSGDIGNQSLATDNSHHVVTTTGVSDQTIIDGFTIRDGNGAGGSFSGNGGGWLNNGSNAVSNPVLKNIKFIANKGVSGAAMYNNGLNGEASPAVINCVFAQNVVTGNGGAVYNQASSGKAAAKFINCTFYNNQAGGEGGAIYNYFNQATPKADLYIYNSILWENKSNTSTTTTINNDFFSENYRVTIWRSLVQASNGSLNRGINPTLSSVSITYNQNPKFIDESTLDLRLNTTSPAKNGGSAALFGLASIIQPAIDLTGISRILDGTIDMGAYECPTKLYVNDEATGDDGGADWANATHDLQKALKAAVPNTEIWVAAGTYKPTTGTDRTISFQLPDSVKIYGGFAGNEATNYNLDLRNFTTNETILSGDIGTLNNSTDNTYHVVFTKNVSPETVVDGLTITEGNAANDPFPNNSGGGWLNDGYGTGNSSNPTLANCTFASNTAGRSGGAMYNDGETGVSSPVLTNCTFTSNTAESDGGAMYNAGSDGISNPTLTNCTFTSNTAGRSGGAIYNDGRYGKSSPNFTQCSFTSNNATEDGGAIYWRGGVINSQLINCVFNANGTEHLYYYEVSNYKAKLINCTFYGATERVIRGFFDSGIGNESPVDFTNCIFWGNGNNIVDKDIDNTAFTANPNTMVNITHSIVEEVAFTQGIFSGNNNLNLPPRFLDATNGIFNINCASAARNTGTLTGAPAIDITGFARTGNPDMGAYEYGYALIQNDLAASLYIPIQGVPSITASSEILNDNNVLMQGIQSVLLAPGFEVAPELGDGSNPTVFKAEIGGGCN